MVEFLLGPSEPHGTMRGTVKAAGRGVGRVPSCRHAAARDGHSRCQEHSALIITFHDSIATSDGPVVRVATVAVHNLVHDVRHRTSVDVVHAK